MSNGAEHTYLLYCAVLSFPQEILERVKHRAGVESWEQFPLPVPVKTVSVPAAAIPATVPATAVTVATATSVAAVEDSPEVVEVQPQKPQAAAASTAEVASQPQTQKVHFFEIAAMPDFAGVRPDHTLSITAVDKAKEMTQQALHEEQEKRFMSCFGALFLDTDRRHEKEIAGLWGELSEEERAIAGVAKDPSIPASAAYAKVNLSIGEEVAFAWITGGDYLEDAQFNVDHFSPYNVQVYEIGHRLALRFAKLSAIVNERGHNGDDKLAAELLRRALLIEGFAMHYLQDAFAAGHTELVPRMELKDQCGAFLGGLLSKGQHDEQNRNGVVYTDGNGKTWVGYGDAHLLDVGKGTASSSDNRENLNHTIDVCYLSMAEVFEAANIPGCVSANKGALKAKKEALYPKSAKLRDGEHELFMRGEGNQLLRRKDFHNPKCSEYLTEGAGLKGWEPLPTAIGLCLPGTCASSSCLPKSEMAAGDGEYLRAKIKTYETEAAKIRTKAAVREEAPIASGSGAVTVAINAGGGDVAAAESATNPKKVRKIYEQFKALERQHKIDKPASLKQLIDAHRGNHHRGSVSILNMAQRLVDSGKIKQEAVQSGTGEPDSVLELLRSHKFMRQLVDVPDASVGMMHANVTRLFEVLVAVHKKAFQEGQASTSTATPVAPVDVKDWNAVLSRMFSTKRRPRGINFGERILSDPELMRKVCDVLRGVTSNIFGAIVNEDVMPKEMVKKIKGIFESFTEPAASGQASTAATDAPFARLASASSVGGTPPVVRPESVLEGTVTFFPAVRTEQVLAGMPGSEVVSQGTRM